MEPVKTDEGSFYHMSIRYACCEKTYNGLQGAQHLVSKHGIAPKEAKAMIARYREAMRDVHEEKRTM